MRLDRGEQWLAANMNNILAEPYARQNGLEGYVAFWTAVRDLSLRCLPLIKNLDVLSVKLVAYVDWKALYQEIDAFPLV